MNARSPLSRFILAALATLLLCANAAAATPADAASPNPRFEYAMELYSQGKWPAAYGRFAALADQGHAEAARIALLMFRHGARLYGHDWAAAPSQISLWKKLAVQDMHIMTAESAD